MFPVQNALKFIGDAGVFAGFPALTAGSRKKPPGLSPGLPVKRLWFFRE
jgi:hypothetical protein